MIFTDMMIIMDEKIKNLILRNTIYPLKCRIIDMLSKVPEKDL